MAKKRTLRAFTLVELVLAIAITALIGLAAAGMAAAISHSSATTQTMQGSITSARTATLSLETMLRKARLITAGDGHNFVLWMGDGNANDKINLDELTLIQYLSASRTVESWQVVFPASMSQQLKLALNEDLLLDQVTTVSAVRTVMQRAVYSNHLSKQVLATDVESFDAVALGLAPPRSQAMLLRLAVGPIGKRITLADAAGPRADLIRCVQDVNGHPYLNMELQYDTSAASGNNGNGNATETVMATATGEEGPGARG